MKMNQKDVFRRGGRGVFPCGICTRKCRETREQSMGSDLCTFCWQLAGIENEISDGHVTLADRKSSIWELVYDIERKKGDASSWRETFPSVFESETKTETKKENPQCPHCQKNDQVFKSAMFSKKDWACTRCKRTFRPLSKRSAAGVLTPPSEPRKPKQRVVRSRTVRVRRASRA